MAEAEADAPAFGDPNRPCDGLDFNFNFEVGFGLGFDFVFDVDLEVG